MNTEAGPDHPVKGPLSDVRVVDLSRLAPGPYCTMLLADLAEVHAFARHEPRGEDAEAVRAYVAQEAAR
jgi:crotonobetainyl-CoA:carnitine CoA-transferase CaiB-like acyl-CoA transferase